MLDDSLEGRPLWERAVRQCGRDVLLVEWARNWVMAQDKIACPGN
jgi:hypothetical protein